MSYVSIIAMTLKVQKWGNSLAIRIPSGVARDAHLREGTAVDVSADEVKVVLRRSVISSNGARLMRKPKYTLDELLAQVTDENRQELIEWGSPRGNEDGWNELWREGKERSREIGSLRTAESGIPPSNEPV